MYEVDMVATGKLIAQLRKEKGLTQGALAELINASVQAVSKWERGNGFPEIYYQHFLCDIFNITLEELHSGQINTLKRKKIIFYKKYQKIITILLLIITPIFIFLFGYFCYTHNSLHYYSIVNEKDKNVYINGIVVEYLNEYTIYIGNIEFYNFDLKKDDIVTVRIFSKGKEIYYSTDINQSIIKLSNKEIDINNVNLYITVNSIYREEYTYKVKMLTKAISKDTVDSNFENENDNILIDNDIIINNLIKNGFTSENNNKWVKKDKKVSLEYFVSQNKLTYIENIPSQQILLVIYYSFNKLNSTVYNVENGVQSLFEKYEYDVENQKLRCDVGSCSSIDDTLKIYKKYYNLLFVESSSTKK